MLLQFQKIGDEIEGAVAIAPRKRNAALGEPARGLLRLVPLGLGVPRVDGLRVLSFSRPASHVDGLDAEIDRDFETHHLDGQAKGVELVGALLVGADKQALVDDMEATSVAFFD